MRDYWLEDTRCARCARLLCHTEEPGSEVLECVTCRRLTAGIAPRYHLDLQAWLEEGRDGNGR